MKTIAVIGCGGISDAAHFPALSEMKNVRIKYACDIVLERAVDKKNKYPKVEQVIEDYKIALNDPEVDAVYVLTLNYAHYTITMDALRAGKHVFVEKPITVNYELAKEMAEEAEKRGLILNIGVCNRFQKSVMMLEDLVKQGRFGNIYHVYCSFRGVRSIPGLGGAFTTKAQAGGGVLIDWGVHFLDLILFILGGAKVKNVTCDTYSELAKDMKSYKYHNMWAKDTSDIENGTNDVEDFVTGYIRTDKASISFNGSWAQNISQEEMFVDFLGDKAGARLTYAGKFEIFDGETLETIKPNYELNGMDIYRDEDIAFIESITTGKKNRSNVEYVLESAKLLDALYKSADIKKEIEL